MKPHWGGPPAVAAPAANGGITAHTPSLQPPVAAQMTSVVTVSPMRRVPAAATESVPPGVGLTRTRR